jgi:flagellar hook protein FlgE
MSTALTGMSAAETTVDVVGNNLANSNTVGFKESEATFATQFLQTLSLGAAPTADQGGINPQQLGLGTINAGVTPNFGQGTISTSTSPSDMAIQGDGFFIVQGSSSQQLYTRNGQFSLNSSNELVNTTGQRLLGYGVDNSYNVTSTTLEPLTIPMGSAAVAQATSVANVQGTLSPTGALANQAQIIESDPLTDGQYTGPAAGESATAAATPSSPTAAGEAVSGPNPSQYTYALAYYNSSSGAESLLSSDISGSAMTTPDAIGPNGASTTLSALPSIPSAYDTLQIYRTEANTPGTYYLVGQMDSAQLSASNSTYVDSVADTGKNPYTTGTGTAPSVTGTTVTDGELTANATYDYEVVYYNSQTKTEGMPSSQEAVTLTSGQDHVALTNIPSDSSGDFDSVRIYRTLANAPNTYYLVATEPMGTTSYTDTTSDAALASAPQLNTSMLSATTYQYYFTYYNAAGLESPPQVVPTQCLMNSPGRITLTGIPVPPTGSGWTGVNIYRNTANNQTTYYQVAQIANPTTGMAYTDSTSDSVLSQSTKTLNFVGVPITNSSLLTNVLRWDGTTYEQVFQPGTLSLTPSVGGSQLTTQQLTITSTSTVQDLMNFIQQATGIQTNSGDPANPMPPSNLVTGGTIAPGVSLDNGRIRVVGNNGTGNAVNISASSITLTPAGQTAATTVNLPFTTTQSAVGESATTDFVVYDSLGEALNVTLTAVLQSTSATATTYRWFADSPNNDPTSGVNIAVGTGLISFNGNGNFVSATNSSVSIYRSHVAAISPETFNLNFSQVSGLATTQSSLAISSQDGSAAGVLTSYNVGDDGVIRGVFSNGVTRNLGQIVLARFANPNGLEQDGQNLFSAGVNSGLPIHATPGQQGIGTVVAGADEMSNTDIGSNLIQLILSSTMYSANSRVITTVQTMFDDLLSLVRTT